MPTEHETMTRLICRLTTLLDAAQPLLDRAAAAEKKAEAGKAMRQITAQERAKAAIAVVHEAQQWIAQVSHG